MKGTTRQAFVDLALANERDTDAVKPWREIQQAGDRTAQLTSRLLSLCRCLPNQHEPLSLNEVVQGLGSMLYALLRENGGAIVLETQGSAGHHRAQDGLLTELSREGRCALLGGPRLQLLRAATDKDG